jgi:hypothetical protein
MLEELFFAIGLVNNVILISIFLLAKKKKMDDVKRLGQAYLLLAIPALYGLYLVAQEQKAWQFGAFMGIFIAYLALEALYDFVLKLDFRHSWKLLVPYLGLYFAMNYGFVVMVWKWSLPLGLLMLALFAAQVAINLWTNHADIFKGHVRPFYHKLAAITFSLAIALVVIALIFIALMPAGAQALAANSNYLSRAQGTQVPGNSGHCLGCPGCPHNPDRTPNEPGCY